MDLVEVSSFLSLHTIVLNRVHDAVTTWPRWMQLNLARVVSHHPLRDVSIITWFMFLIGCRIFGERKQTTAITRTSLLPINSLLREKIAMADL